MKINHICNAAGNIYSIFTCLNTFKREIFFIGIILFSQSMHAQPLHEYYFNGDLSEKNGGPNLVEKLNCSATNGSFINESITFRSGLTCASTKVFSFKKGGGISYQNPNYINKQYTINMLFEIDTFPTTIPKWIRLVDFFDLTSDDGAYFYDSSLVFYYSYGNHCQGTPLYFRQKTYYLLTLTRNEADDSMKIYIDGNLFARSKDTRSFFPATSNTPINFFTDDGVVTCEAQPGHIKYLSITSQVYTASDIASLWGNLCPIIMPIKLSNFNIECINNTSKKISWSTESEVNNDYFTLERSTDAIHWNAIKKIKSKGNSSTTNHYTEWDNYASNDKNIYYRLKQTDYNGKFFYNEVKTSPICNKNSIDENLIVYPNPVQNQLTIKAGKNNIGHDYKIIDNTGRKVITGKITDEYNMINMSQIASGIYLLQLEKEAQFTKIIKK